MKDLRPFTMLSKPVEVSEQHMFKALHLQEENLLDANKVRIIA
jgi:hypothetical protein